jgi:hypothetical protein
MGDVRVAREGEVTVHQLYEGYTVDQIDIPDFPGQVTVWDEKLLELWDLNEKEILEYFPKLRSNEAFANVPKEALKRACLVMIRDQFRDEVLKRLDIRGVDPDEREWEKDQLKPRRGRIRDEMLWAFREVGFNRDEAFRLAESLLECFMPEAAAECAKSMAELAEHVARQRATGRLICHLLAAHFSLKADGHDKPTKAQIREYVTKRATEYPAFKDEDRWQEIESRGLDKLSVSALYRRLPKYRKPAKSKKRFR